MSSPFSSRALTVLLAALCAAIFFVDLRTPLGYAVPLLYGLPLLVTLWHPARRAPLWVAAVVTVLIVMGYLKAAPVGMASLDLVNRGLTIGLGWCLAALLISFKRTHMRLADSDSNLLRTQRVVDAAPDAIFFADMRKRIIYANDEACRSLGYTREELLRLRVSDISPGHEPARYEKRLEALRRGQVDRYESVHRRKDGTEFPIEMTLSYQEQGRRRVTCAIARDITARKQVEAELAETAVMIEMVIEGSPDPIFLKDREGKYLLMNRAGAEFLGRSKEEILGKRDTELFSPDVAAQLRHVDEAVLQSGQAGTFEEVIERPDGTHTFISRKAPFCNATGTIVGLLGLAHDITARKQAEVRLDRRLALEKLVADISTRLNRITYDRVDEEMLAALARIGQLLEVDRGYVFMLSEDGVTMSNTHEWCAAGISSEKEKLQQVHVEAFPWWIERLRRDELIAIPSVVELPSEADAERIALPVQGVQALIALPLTRAGRLIGFFGFDSVKAARIWPDEDVLLLRTLGKMFVHAHDRLQSEAALAASEARFRAVYQSAAVGMTLCATEGILQAANPRFCEILGRPESELIGYRFTDFMHPEESPDNWEQLHRLVSREAREITFEKRYLRKDGSVVWVALSATHLVEGEGEIRKPYLLTIVQDITARKQAEEAVQRSHRQLEESESFLRSVLDKLPHMVFIKDAQALRFVRFNKAAEELVGLTESEVLGKNDYDFFPKEQADFFVAKDRGVLESGQVLEIDAEPIQTTHRGLRYLRTKKFPLHDTEGRPRYLVGLSEDITDRIKIESALRESEERFRSAFEMSPIGMALCSPEGRFVRLNLQFCHLLGYAESELRGRHVSEVTHPDEVTRSGDGLAALVSGQISVYVDEQRVLRKDGAVLTVLLTLSTIRNHEGLPLFNLAQIQDLTALRKTEADLRQARELAEERARFEALVAALPDLAFVVDADGRYREVLAGAEAELNRPAQEVLGRTFHDVFPPELADRFLEFVGRAIDSKESQILQYALPMSDGLHWYEAKSSPPLSGGSGPPAVLCVVRDITERMRSQALEERERIGRDLHDGLLQSLYATGLALESSQDLLNERPHEGRQLLNKVVEQLNGVMQEVRQLIIGLDAGVLQSDDWEAAARLLIQSHSALCQVRSEIAIDPQAQEALSVAQRLALLNILREALSNALRHGRPQSIIVHLSRTDETIRLRVADDGRGFPPTAIGKAGFGLRNMKARADQLGAVFQVTSELGKGTEIIIEVRSQEALDHARIPR